MKSFSGKHKSSKCNATFSNDLKKEQAKAKVDFDLYKKEQCKRAKETTDLVDILEVTVENKNTEIKDLKNNCLKLTQMSKF